MVKHWRWFFLIGLVALLFALSACSENTEEDADADEGATDDQETAADDNEPKAGGTYTISLAADPDTLDPHVSPAAWTNYLLGLTNNKLVTYKTGDDMSANDYEIVPDLAEEWEVSEDGSVYTFHLREAYWHDIEPVNGRQFDSGDVLATMERIQTLPGHQVGLLEMVEKIEAPDDMTVVFTLSQPFAPFLNFMADHFMWIIPKEAADGEVDLNTEMIGTGPFMLEDRQLNVETTFIRNPNFFEEDKPYLDKVELKFIPENASAIAAFRSGQVDQMMNTLSPEEVDNLLEGDAELISSPGDISPPVQMFMNMTREPFDDLQVRKAISLAIDRQGLVDNIFGGGVVGSPVSPGLGDWALDLEEREELQGFDIEKAKEMLAEAGYPDGFDLTIMSTNAYGEQLIRATQWISEDLKAIGINADIEMIEYAEFISEKWPKLNYDIGVGFQTPLQEADGWLRQLHSEGSRNWYGIDDPKLDEMIDEQRVIMDVDERKAKVHDIQRYALENVVNPLFISNSQTNSAIKPYVRNWKSHSSYGWLNMKNLWLDKEE